MAPQLHGDLIDPSTWEEALAEKTLDKELMARMLRKMTLIRRFEQKVNELFLRGYIPGTIHLSLGQEAVPVGVTTALREDDVILPTHRGHGHALAKGMPAEALFAELFARSDGCSKGKGGSLHIGDVTKGIMPANPVVGSSVPVAAGIGFSFKYRGQERIAACFFGDGAINTGPLHEGLNLAALWKLPVLYVCENNQYAISTPIQTVTLRPLSERAEAYGMPAQKVDGNDVVAVYEAAREAVSRVRAGEGPFFLECVTYRQGGHKRDDPGTYRAKEEVEHWLSLDPLPRIRERVVTEGVLSAEQVLELERSVDKEIEAAVQTALSSPPPDPASALIDVYA
jgi:pyruvate dehydrogenase E1 component alpha subunit